MMNDDLRRIAPLIFAGDGPGLLAGLRAHGFLPVRASQGAPRFGDRHARAEGCMIHFRHPDHAARSRMGGVAPEVVLLNSPDSAMPYRVLAGVFRSIGENSMILPADETTDIRVSRSGDMVGSAIEASFAVITAAEMAITRAEAWERIALQPAEREIMAEAAHVARFGQPGMALPPIPAAKLLGVRRIEDRGNDLWRVHNVLQENIMRGGLHGWARDATGKRRRTTMREVRAIDGTVRLNRALWSLSARVAALKGAPT